MIGSSVDWVKDLQVHGVGVTSSDPVPSLVSSLQINRIQLSDVTNVTVKRQTDS